MNPTVSLSSTRRREGRARGRTVGSSVANMRASASTPACVSRLKSVDFPALVYPASASVASGTADRRRRWSARPALTFSRFVFDLLDPAGDAPPVRFQLGLARTSRADSAAQPRHLHAVAGQPRQQVVQLGEFHLQAAFPGVGARGEDIENQLGSIDDFRVERLFQVALLGGSQVVVEDHDIHAHPTRTEAASSSTLPCPSKVEASGAVRTCTTRSVTSAPAVACQFR